MADDYWTQRLDDIFARLDKTDDALNQQLLRQYQKASDVLAGKIDDFWERYAGKNGISYAQAQKRIRKTDMASYVENAEAYRKANEDNPELLKRLNAQLVNSEITRLELLKYELDFEVYKATVDQDAQFTDYLQKTSEYVYGALQTGKAIRTLNQREIDTILKTEWSGANYSQRLWKDADALAQRLKEELTRAAVRGDNPKVTAKRMRDIFGANKYVTERLTRTESTYVANATTAKRYQDMGVRRYTFEATLDRRTSTICRELDGNEYDLSEFQPGVNAPAMHPNCRSHIVPASSELTKYNKYLDEGTVDDLDER